MNLTACFAGTSSARLHKMRAAASMVFLGTLVAVTLAAPPPGGSAYYSVSYSGGIITVTPRGGTASSMSYYLSNNRWGHGGGCQYGTSSATGTITTTFTWHGDTNNDGVEDVPPPPKLLIKEESSASITAGSTGTTDNGLPGQVSPRYWWKTDPGESFQIECTPDVHATHNGNWGMSVVSYKATPYVVKINFSGVLPNTNNLLVGQRLTASLETGGLTLTSRSWNTEDSKPFVDYTVGSSPLYCPAALTHFTPQTTTSMQCYYGEPGQAVAVECTFYVQGYSSALTIEDDVDVDGTTGSIGVEIGSTEARDMGTNLWELNLFESQPYHGSPSWGIIWWTNIKAPQTYYTQYGSYGSPFFCQLVLTDRGKEFGQSQWNIQSTEYVLDTVYPYPHMAGDPDGIVSNDAPSEALGFSGLTMCRVNDSFHHYVMYDAPGTAHKSVPIKETGWYWAGRATPDGNGGWQDSDCSQGWGYIGDYPHHPEWTLNVTQLEWVLAP